MGFYVKFGCLQQTCLSCRKCHTYVFSLYWPQTPIHKDAVHVTCLLFRVQHKLPYYLILKFSSCYFRNNTINWIFMTWGVNHLTPYSSHLLKTFTRGDKRTNIISTCCFQKLLCFHIYLRHKMLRFNGFRGNEVIYKLKLTF